MIALFFFPCSPIYPSLICSCLHFPAAKRSPPPYVRLLLSILTSLLCLSISYTSHPSFLPSFFQQKIHIKSWRGNYVFFSFAAIKPYVGAIPNNILTIVSANTPSPVFTIKKICHICPIWLLNQKMRL